MSLPSLASIIDCQLPSHYLTHIPNVRKALDRWTPAQGINGVNNKSWQLKVDREFSSEVYTPHWGWNINLWPVYVVYFLYGCINHLSLPSTCIYTYIHTYIDLLLTFTDKLACMFGRPDTTELAALSKVCPLIIIFAMSFLKSICACIPILRFRGEPGTADALHCGNQRYNC